MDVLVNCGIKQSPNFPDGHFCIYGWDKHNLGHIKCYHYLFQENLDFRWFSPGLNQLKCYWCVCFTVRWYQIYRSKIIFVSLLTSTLTGPLFLSNCLSQLHWLLAIQILLTSVSWWMIQTNDKGNFQNHPLWDFTWSIVRQIPRFR